MEIERKSASIFSNCPYEIGSKAIVSENLVKPIISDPILDPPRKNPMRVSFADEHTRGAINKATLPFYMIRPPFGLPRFKDVNILRRLGNTAQARMAKDTIIDQIVTIPWDIVPADEELELTEAMKNEQKEIKSFFMNPNTNNESLEYLMRQMMEDNLDIDSGIWVKEFDQFNRMVEIKTYDAATFLKNPNIYGKFDDKAEIIPVGSILSDKGGEMAFDSIGNQITADRASDAAVNFLPNQGISSVFAKEKAAYFQYFYSGGVGVNANVRPIAFGRREIVWFEKNPQTWQVYGHSPIESLLEILQNLQYSIEYSLDYFEDNNVPKGFIQLTGADEEEMDAFRDKWNELQLKTNAQGLLKKNFHRVPITNVDNASFVRIQFSSAELELIESQKWFSKLVWAMFGVNASELGFSEDSNLATDIAQSRKFKKKAILPRLRMIEYFIDNNILSEWDFGDKWKFKFNTFDIEDEKLKMELFKLQLESGFKTVNEIRVEEGLEELSEEELNPNMQTVGDDETGDKDDQKPNDPNPEDSKKRAEKKSNTIKEMVGITSNNEDSVSQVRNVREQLSNQNPTLEEVNRLFSKTIKLDETRLLKELRNNGTDRLTQIKSFSSILNALKGLLSVENLKGLIGRITSALFNKGIQETETMVKSEGIDVNAVSSSPDKVTFLSNMAFENIKGLSEEMKRKLRQQLKMGISQGEGIGMLTQRVKSIFNTTESRLDMITRTESVRIKGLAQQHAAMQIQADGVNIKKWILMVDDSRTSPLSRALNVKYGTQEQAIPVDQNFKLKSAKFNIDQITVPFHPNERCLVIQYIVDRGE